MGRRRNLDSSISHSKDVNRLAQEAGDFAALLYTWGFAHAEEDCSLPHDPDELAALLVPMRRDKSVEQIGEARDLIMAAGLWMEDPDDSGRLMYPPDTFYKYQSYIPQDRRRRLPVPARARKGTEGHGGAPNRTHVRHTPSTFGAKAPQVVGKTAEELEEEAAMICATFPFPNLLTELAGLMALENKSGKVSLRRVLNELYRPLAALSLELSQEELRRGLDAAIRAGAPNANYVKKAGRNGSGRGPAPPAACGPPRAEQLTEHDLWALDDPELAPIFRAKFGHRLGLEPDPSTTGGAQG